MSKFVGFVIGAIEIGVGIATGNPLLIILGGLTAGLQAVVDLTAQKQPARDASEMTIQLGEQPRVMGVGEFYTPGSLVDGFDYGGKYGTDHEVLIIRLLDEPATSLTGFYVNDEYVPYTGDGNYPQFDSHHFSLWFRANTSVDPLPDVVLDHGPGWTSSDIGSSGCDVIVDYLADAPDAKHPAWPGGRPRFGFVLKGGKRYDPRKDDTVTGGSGTHRRDDPATWEWSENAVICWYGFEIGIYVDGDTTDPTKLLVGRGLTAEESPPENIFAAANLCDEIAATIHPYDQEPSSSESSGGFAFGAGYMIRWDNDGTIEWFNNATRTNLGRTSDPPSGLGPTANTVSNVALSNDGTAYYYGTVTTSGNNYLYETPALGTTSVGDPIGNATHRDPGPCRVFDLSDGTRKIYGGVNWTDGGYYEGESLTDDPDAYLDFFRDDNDGIWGLHETSGTGISFTQLVGGSTSFTVTGSVSRSTPDISYACYVASTGNIYVLTDGHWYLIDLVGQTIVDSGTQSYSGGDWLTGRLQQSPGNNEFFYSGMQQISLVDGSVIRSLTSSDWLVESVPGASAYDAVNNSIDSFATGHVTFRLLDRNGGFRVAGPIYSNQEHIDVEQMFAAACGGNIVTHEGQVLLEPGQAKSVTATFTDDDLVVGTKVSCNHGFLSQSDSDWLNTVVGNYIEPDQKWNPHNTPPLRDNDDIAADGKPREQQLSLRLVRYIAQAMRVCEFARRLGRLWYRATVTLGPRHCEIEAGDWVQWTSTRFGFTKTFLVTANNIDEKWQNTLTLREASASVYADDASFPSDHSQPTTTLPPPDIGEPDSDNWALTAITLDSAGASVPALHFAGDTSDDGYVQAVITEYWKDDGVGDPVADVDSVSWIVAGRDPPSSTFIKDITSVIGGATYYGAVTYVVGGESGDRLLLGPVTLSDYTSTAYQMEDGVTHITLEDDLTDLSLEIA